MIKATLYFALLFFLSTFSHGQTGFPIPLDTTAKINLGYQKKSLWSFPLEKNQQLLNFNLDQTLKSPSKKRFTNSMPIYGSEGNHIMPVHAPGSSITYKMPVLSPDSFE